MVAQQGIELVGKCVPNERHPDHPRCGSQQIEPEEPSPRHFKAACHGTGDGPEPEDKAREEDGSAPVRLNQLPGYSDVLIIEAQQFFGPADKCLSEVMAQQVAEIVAHNRGDDSDQNHPLYVQPGLLMSQETREHQQSFAGKRQSHALAEQSQQQCPVAPRDEEMADHMVEPVHSRLRCDQTETWER